MNSKLISARMTGRNNLKKSKVLMTRWTKPEKNFVSGFTPNDAKTLQPSQVLKFKLVVKSKKRLHELSNLSNLQL